MSTLEHRHLRSALEFAVLVAAEGQKRRPPLAFPKELKQYFGVARIPSGALGRIRRAVENDDRFRRGLAAGAQPELVDDVGRCWLEARSGWERRIEALIDEQQSERESTDLRRDLKRAEKRRQAAEQAAARTRVELLQQRELIDTQRTEIDLLHADLLKANDAVEEMRVELIDTRNEARHARDRERSALARIDELHEQRAAPGPAAPTPVNTAPAQPGPDRAELRSALDAAQALVSSLEALTAEPESSRSARSGAPGSARRPLAVPSGIISTSAAAADHLVRTGATIFVDGYNVAKLGWPDVSLEQQRTSLISGVENLARRVNADITVVFDGASVVGAHAQHRRSIRVLYSPAGITADDMIRSEVAAMPGTEPVIVVTNDREIVDDVRAVGANVIPSNALLAVL